MLIRSLTKMFKLNRLKMDRINLEREMIQIFRDRPATTRLSEEISPQAAAILSPLREIPRHQLQEQQQAESGQISATQSYWNSLSGQCQVLRLEMTNLDQDMGALEVRQLSEPMEFLGVTRREPAQDGGTELAILRNLERISPENPQRYGLTRAALGNMCLRFIQNSNSPNPTSYIAISYRWAQDQIAVQQKIPQLGAPVKFPPNFPPVLYKAILNERETQNEGVWIDQLCINQENSVEKENTVPAMDLIYQRARLTVVVIGDIRLIEF